MRRLLRCAGLPSLDIQTPGTVEPPLSSRISIALSARPTCALLFCPSFQSILLKALVACLLTKCRSRSKLRPGTPSRPENCRRQVVQSPPPLVAVRPRHLWQPRHGRLPPHYMLALKTYTLEIFVSGGSSGPPSYSAQLRRAAAVATTLGSHSRSRQQAPRWC